MGSEVGMILSYSKSKPEWRILSSMRSMCYWTGEGLTMMMMVRMKILRQSPLNFLNIENLMKIVAKYFFPSQVNFYATPLV